MLIALLACAQPETEEIETDWTYAIVDTSQSECYDTAGNTGCPALGENLYGQDAQYSRNAPDYLDNNDGTVSDLRTGLIWQQEQLDGVAYDDAADYCDSLDLGSRTDWRVPSTKEMYSLILFDGATGTSTDESFTDVPDDALPYIDDTVFDFSYGDIDGGERYIDVQFITTTLYVSEVFADNSGTMAGQEAFFGVNFADGRIKGYPTGSGTWQLRCVAGSEDYGVNDFADSGDGTISDAATGLTWSQGDSGEGMDWGDALAYCEDLTLGDADDWRLPSAKELHSIVDYSRSPDTTGSAAIDPLFSATEITDEAGEANFGFYWSSTTHLDGLVAGTDAIYVAFGEALGYMSDAFLDVHGAGAQRGDPKTGAESDYPQWGMGPQGDVRRVFNLVRCVRTTE